MFLTFKQFSKLINVIIASNQVEEIKLPHMYIHNVHFLNVYTGIEKYVTFIIKGFLYKILKII